MPAVEFRPPPSAVATCERDARITVPPPLTLLVGCVLVAAALTWILPAGEFQRREDSATGRSVVVPGTYSRTEPHPVGPFQAVVALYLLLIALAVLALTAAVSLGIN